MVCFSVGKTSLITRFMYDSFDNTYQVSVRSQSSTNVQPAFDVSDIDRWLQVCL